MKSVLEQSYPNLEVVIVDDGSTDKSYAVAKKYESNRVKVLRQRNRGAAVARNVGLDASSGDYIQFLDAGDVISREKIAAQVAALRNNSDKIAVCFYRQFTRDKELYESHFVDQSDFIYSTNNPQEFLIRLWGGYGKVNFVQTNCWLVPKTVIDKAGSWRAYRCPDDDGEFFARVLLASKGIVYVPDVYNFYHISPGGVNQLSRSTNPKYLMNTLLTIDLKHKYLLAYGPHPRLNRAMAAQYYRYAVDTYPRWPVISAIAWRRFKTLGEKPPRIVLGGRFVQFISQVFGWRVARLLKHYIRRS
jgi:glycosyltransferase involved in cell wall biosynthesis